MPIINSNYQPPKLFNNGHIQTLYPYFFRKFNEIRYNRIRTVTPDGDFLDLDHTNTGSKRLLILSHGLEGSSQSPYIQGMQKHFSSIGFDILAWNMRGCSGEMNKLERFYHGGDSQELDFVIKEALKIKDYEEIYLIGFSLGGNLTLKYIGEYASTMPSQIVKAAVFSSPIDLQAGADQLHKLGQTIYLKDFMRTMKRKIIEKNEIIPIKSADLSKLNEVKNFYDFDNYFTAPLHNFKDALDYYKQCSSKNFLNKITIPTLIVNAKNDPFLGKKNYPIRQAHKSDNIFLEMPVSGGHVGFINFNQKQKYWSETKAENFFIGELRNNKLAL